MCYCGSVSDHIGPSALINLIWFEKTNQKTNKSHQHGSVSHFSINYTNVVSHKVVNFSTKIAFICAKIFLNFKSAFLINIWQVGFSFAINFRRNFAVRISIWLAVGRKWKKSGCVHLPRFMNERVTVNANDRSSHASTGHDSVPYHTATQANTLWASNGKSSSLTEYSTKWPQKLTFCLIKSTPISSFAKEIYTEISTARWPLYQFAITKLWHSHVVL